MRREASSAGASGRRLNAMTLAVVLGAALTVGGCSKPVDEPQVASAGGGTSVGQQAPADDARQREAQFAACMKAAQSGASPAAPGAGPVPRQCERYMPALPSLKPLSQEARAAMLAFARCMRDAGIADYPDPGPEDTAVGIVGPAPNSGADMEAFQAAVEKCRSLLAPAIEPGAPGR